MKVVYLAILMATIGLFAYVLPTSKPPRPENFVMSLGFSECKFEREFAISSSFSPIERAMVEAAMASWVLASDKQICFTLYTKKIKWYEYLTFLKDGVSTLYNTQESVWEQAGLFLNPYCQRIGCVGLAFASRDVFLTNYQLYLVSLHEIGHTLGLGHSPNKADIMYYSVGAIRLSNEDKRVLHCLMQHKKPLLWGNPDCQYKENDNVEDRKQPSDAGFEVCSEYFPYCFRQRIDSHMSQKEHVGLGR